MRSVSRRIAAFIFLLVLVTQSVLAEPAGPRYRDRSMREQIKRFVIAIMDELGGPHP